MRCDKANDVADFAGFRTPNVRFGAHGVEATDGRVLIITEHLGGDPCEGLACGKDLRKLWNLREPYEVGKDGGWIVLSKPGVQAKLDDQSTRARHPDVTSVFRKRTPDAKVSVPVRALKRLVAYATRAGADQIQLGLCHANGGWQLGVLEFALDVGGGRSAYGAISTGEPVQPVKFGSEREVAT